ncbi:hypothetical protein [Nocardia farcinica]|uniref:hypothetical protein n=2 Tax=Nocardia TaxID=1817 RepID=UPI0024572997|nr:hypothetical protein [Nocardia farcinica]
MLDEGVGSAIATQCDTLLDALYRMRLDARALEFLSGYGGLPSAQQLQQKFQQKAVGGGAHDPNDNAISRLNQHIEIVETMRDAYLAAIGRLRDTDQSNSQQMSGQTDQVG